MELKFTCAVTMKSTFKYLFQNVNMFGKSSYHSLLQNVYEYHLQY